jgi:hypothetical protein
MNSEKILLSGEKRRLELRLAQLDIQAGALIDDVRAALLRPLVTDISELPIEIAKADFDKLYAAVIESRELRARLADIEGQL